MRFAGGLPVVPVALRADLGPWRIHTHTLTSGFLANLFWFSFPPRVRLEATVLPPMAPAEVGALSVHRCKSTGEQGSIHVSIA